MKTEKRTGSLSRRQGLEWGAAALAVTVLPGRAAAAGAAELTTLKSSLVRISDEKVIGIGFITEMDGKQYVVTNASVVSGHNQLSFKTLTGKPVVPRKIELSSTRDLARFQTAGHRPLKLQADIKNSAGISVLEYRKSTVVKEQSGTCDVMNSEILKLNSEYTDESNGSPVLNENMEVAASANFLLNYKMQMDSWEGTPCRLAYRLAGAKWYSPNWKQYNRTYGKSLREIDYIRANLYELASEWMKEPKNEIKTDIDLGLDFERWVKQQNDLVSNLGNRVSKNDNGASNRAAVKDFQDVCNALMNFCDSKAKNLTFLLQDKNVTPILKREFKWRALELKKFSRVVEEHSVKGSRDRWR